MYMYIYDLTLWIFSKPLPTPPPNKDQGNIPPKKKYSHGYTRYSKAPKPEKRRQNANSHQET